MPKRSRKTVEEKLEIKKWEQPKIFNFWIVPTPFFVDLSISHLTSLVRFMCPRENQLRPCQLLGCCGV